jgi:membrane-associated HD superfamily phosphohydrolase
VLRLTAHGQTAYFRSFANRFDFILVVGSVVSSIVTSGVIGLMLRTFRIIRIFRLVRMSKGMQSLLRTLVYSLPSFINVMMVIVLNFSSLPSSA